MLFHLIYISILILITGCSNLVNEESLKTVRGLYYNPNDGKPFSGKVYRLYSNGMKMRDGYFDIGDREARDWPEPYLAGRDQMWRLADREKELTNSK